MYEENICKKCHLARSENLKEPCKHCKARKTIFGYRYEHEFKAWLTAVVIVTVFAVIATIAGVAFILYFSL